MKSVTRVVQEMVMNNGEPLKSLASKIGKPYPTLLRELNPYDKGAKLGVETMLDLMQATQDYRPLQYMADTLGLAVTPKPEISQHNGNGHGSSYKYYETLTLKEPAWERESTEQAD